MSRRIIICEERNKLAATLEVILRQWGYCVLTVNRAAQAMELLEAVTPELLLINSRQAQTDSKIKTHLEKSTEADRTPVILLDAESGHADIYPVQDHLHIPFDIFELFGLVQKHLEKIPRRNLRMDISLPGLFDSNNTNQLIEVLSLSSHGLFVKTGIRANVGQIINIVLPLLGLKREIEVSCRVLYVIQPCLENNFLQGFGVEFVSPAEPILEAIRHYLEKRLLGEIENLSGGIHGGIEIDQLQTHIPS